LISRYDLFEFRRLQDDAVFNGAALADLDWQRRYTVRLLPIFAADLPQLRDWTTARWKQLGGVAPEYAALENVLARYDGQGRSALLEVLHDTAIFGWLPRAAVERVAWALSLPVADVQGVIEFYEMFHDQPIGKNLIRVCEDGPCALRGSDQLLHNLCSRLAIAPGGTTADSEYTRLKPRAASACAITRPPHTATASDWATSIPTILTYCSQGRPRRSRI
jgi:NADH:ubiquinone oxidoreductase subunit E